MGSLGIGKMTGKRHHYVPQFLQQGFNSRIGRETPRTWLYRKGAAAPVEATLRHVGVEVSFYRYKALGVDISADEAITRAEGQRLAPLVRRLRAENPVSERDAAALAELFAHIYARTKAVWEIGKMQTPRMFERLSAFVRDPQAIQSVLPRLLETQRPIFMQLLPARYPDCDIGKVLAEYVEQLGAASPAEPCSSDVIRMLDDLLELAFRALQVSKVKSMQELSERPEVARRFQGCTFSILEWYGAHLVQGDTPVVFYRVGGFTPILAKDESFDYAVLPLTPTRVVVASTSGDMPNSWETLRDASIACSYQHFIGAACYPELETLSATLGSEFPAVTDADIERLFTEAVELASTPGWMGPEVRAFLERLVQKYLWAPQDGGVAAPGALE